MKHLSIALIYIGFFSLIAIAIYLTESAHCLWALILTPSVKWQS